MGGVLAAKPSLLVTSLLLTGGGLSVGAVKAGLDNKEKISSAWQAVSLQLSKIFSSGDSSAKVMQTDFCQNFSGLCSFPGKVSSSVNYGGEKAFSSLKQLVTFFAAIKTHYQTASTYSQEINSKFLSDKQELKKVLQSLVEGFPKLLKYIYDSKKQEEIKKLFGRDEYQKTMEGLKWLSGANSGSAKIFDVEQGLLAHLMSNLLRDPDKALPKTKRFIQLIGEHKKDSVLYNGGGVHSQQSSIQPYKLTKKRLDKFMKDRNEAAQNIYELLLMGEIGASAKGIAVPEGTESVTSLLASMFSIFAGRGSSLSSQSK